MQYNCPVCNKSGLPNYKSVQIICPQCNSDLSAYRYLEAVSGIRVSKNALLLFITLSIVTIIFAFLYFNSLSGSKNASQNTTIISELRDSVSNLQAKLKPAIIASPEANSRPAVIEYKVRHGDCPSKIAQYFYNDWKMYKKIEADNNLIRPYVLRVGQKLKINLSQ